jgi:ADP-ribose pyrophosphatase YjhB (NUDIX family)
MDHGNLMHTNYQFEFCPMCGGKCKSLNLKEHEPTRLVCSDCDFIFYLDPKLVACVIVESEGKIVLLKRDIEPQKGKWVMPGGYVDRGEVVEAAALRETEEECGLKIRLKNLLGVYSYTGKLEVVIVYVAEVTSGNLMVGDETQAARLFDIGDIPWEKLAFESTQDALRDYCKRGENIENDD